MPEPDSVPPCLGRTIVITRPAGRQQPLVELIEAAGGRIIHIPLQVLQPVRRDDPELANLPAPDSVDLMIFTSRPAVLFARQLVPDWFPTAKGTIVLAVGPGTALELKSCGVRALYNERACPGSEGVLDLPELQKDVVRDKQVVIVRGDSGREILRDELQKRGARVSYAGVYTRSEADTAAAELRRLWQAERPDVIVVTNTQSLEILVARTIEKYRQLLLRTALAVISKRIAEHAQSLGFVGDCTVADSTDDEGLLRAITRCYEG